MSPLTTSTESLGKDQVRLRVEVPETDLAPALADAYRRWGSQVKVPGFRKGKVPRQLIDAHVGVEAVREDALREALPDLYRQALQAESIQPIAAPDIEVMQWEQGSPLVFEATVDVRPDIELPDLSALEIQSPPAEVTDDEIDQQMERLRDRFAELESSAAPAREGHHVLIDLKAYRGDEPVDEAGAPDLLYEIGSQAGPPKLDTELQGVKAGAILRFTDTPPGSGEELSFTVLVKEVKVKKLPDADDAFAKTVGEFDSLEALREDLRTRMAGYKWALVEEQIRSLAVEALLDTSAFEAPEKLVDAELSHRIEHIEADLKRMGATLAQYAEQIGSTELEVRSELRTQAQRSVKAELLLEEIARREEIDVTEEDLGREISLAAARSGQDPSKVAEQLVAEGGLSAVAADIMRRKAVEHVVAAITVKDRPERPEIPEDERLSDGDAS